MSSLPLYKRIQLDIKEQISHHILRVGDLVPSESELMKKYFVSSITVKNALNGLVDDGLIYRVRGKGTFVAYNPFETDESAAVRKSEIGCVFATLSTRVQQLFLIGLEKECDNRNSQISIGISRESSEHEMQIIQSMISNGCRGLIIDPCVSEIDGAMARLLLAKKYPFVFLDRYFPDIPTSYVTCDNRGGAGQAARALLDRYRNEVAIFYFPLFNSAVCERYDGFCAEFVDAGFAMEAKNRCLIDDSGLFYSNNSVRFNLIFETMLAHLKKHPSLRGFFAVNAEIAQVLNIVLHHCDLWRKIESEECGVVSFDNPFLPGFDYVEQDTGRMTAETIRLLYAQIDGDFSPQSITVPTKYVPNPIGAPYSSLGQQNVMGINP